MNFLKLTIIGGALITATACTSMQSYKYEQRVNAHRAMEHYLVGDYQEARAELEYVLKRTRTHKYMIASDPHARILVDPLERQTWIQTLASVYYETGDLYPLRKLVDEEMEGDIRDRWLCRIEEHVGNLAEATGCYANLGDGIGQARVFRRSIVDATLSSH